MSWLSSSGARRDRTVLQFDDATGVPPMEPPWWRDVVGDDQFIAVTLNQFGDQAAAADRAALLARQLVEVSRCTGAAIVLVPHVGDLGASGSRRRHGPGHRRRRGRSAGAAGRARCQPRTGRLDRRLAPSSS